MLVRISGTVSGENDLTLDEALVGNELPVMILAHVESSDGSLAVSVRGQQIELCLSQTYTVRTNTYTLSCYGTQDAFCVAAGNADDSGGYRDMTVERVSVFG